jgi:hypothetical protein
LLVEGLKSSANVEHLGIAHVEFMVLVATHNLLYIVVFLLEIVKFLLVLFLNQFDSLCKVVVVVEQGRDLLLLDVLVLGQKHVLLIGLINFIVLNLVSQ